MLILPPNYLKIRSLKGELYVLHEVQTTLYKNPFFLTKSDDIIS